MPAAIDGGYVTPAAVFRQDNPFGRFRQLLGSDFDAIGALLDRLGVKRIPNHEDARSVLLGIAREERTRFHLPVENEDDLAVIWRCWQMLDGALARDEVDAEWFSPLRELPVVPNAAFVLIPPTRLLIDDMPGVADALNVGDAVIRRKEGMWRAFQAAGVRSLTEAVDVEILQIEETTQARRSPQPHIFPAARADKRPRRRPRRNTATCGDRQATGIPADPRPADPLPSAGFWADFGGNIA